jgi:hypothetical protein
MLSVKHGTRQVIGFVAACLLVGGGLFLLAFEVFYASVVRGIYLMASGALIAAGGNWLMNDFILPLWRKKDVK